MTPTRPNRKPTVRFHESRRRPHRRPCQGFGLLLGVLVTAGLAAAEVPSDASAGHVATMAAAPIGPALPAPIIDLFLPPTRAAEPYAATAEEVFLYSAAEDSWKSIYRPGLKEGRVSGIAGYSRSSKVLYVAHSTGVARTRDRGTTWDELLVLARRPPEGGFLGLSINPTNRYEAVLAHERGLWRVTERAGMFEPVEFDERVGVLRGCSYSGVEPPRLILLGGEGVFMETTLGVWQQLSLPLVSPVAVAVSPNSPLWVAGGATNSWIGEFTRPGYGRMISSEIAVSPAAIALDCDGHGVLWWTTDNRLLQADLKHPEAPPAVIQPTDRPVTLLRAHPREADTVVWVEGSRVFRAADTFAAAAEGIALPLDLNAFQPVPMEPVLFGRTAVVAGGPTMGQVLEEVLAGQPPLKEVVQVALDRARYEPDRVLDWERGVRRRNWLPQVRLGGGFREYSLDRSIIVDEADRFGIVTRNDLRLSDTTEPMGYVGVTLVWDLDRLKYDPEQVDISKEARYQSSYRHSLIKQITELYYARIDTLVKLRFFGDALEDSEAVSLRLKLREATDLINELCDRPVLRHERALPRKESSGTE